MHGRDRNCRLATDTQLLERTRCVYIIGCASAAVMVLLAPSVVAVDVRLVCYI